MVLLLSVLGPRNDNFNIISGRSIKIKKEELVEMRFLVSLRVVFGS